VPVAGIQPLAQVILQGILHFASTVDTEFIDERHFLQCYIKQYAGVLRKDAVEDLGAVADVAAVADPAPPRAAYA